MEANTTSLALKWFYSCRRHPQNTSRFLKISHRLVSYSSITLQLPTFRGGGGLFENIVNRSEFPEISKMKIDSCNFRNFSILEVLSTFLGFL